MAAQFATVEEYFAFIGKAVPSDFDDDDRLDLDAKLARASDIVRHIARLGRVRYNQYGIPGVASLAFEFSRATSAALTWLGGHEADLEEISGKANEWTSVSMIGVSFSRSKGAAGDAASTAGSERIAPESVMILRNAGIFTTRVRSI